MAKGVSPVEKMRQRENEKGETRTGSAHALQGPEDDELVQAFCAATANGESGKQAKGAQKGVAAPKDVRHLCKEHGKAQVAQRVRQRYPVEGVEAVELYGNGIQARGHNGRVQH